MPKYRILEINKKVADALSEKLPVKENMHKTMKDVDN